MLTKALVPALLTGAFCAGFAVLVSSFGMLFAFLPVIAISFVSGFLGSLFATYVTKRR
jgi:hypothetical protein